MGNDLVRQDWGPGGESRSAVSTIAGGSYGGENRVVDVATYRHGVGAQLVQAVQQELTEDDRADLDESVASLPETIQAAFRQELAMGTTGNVRSATTSEIDRFAESSEGAQLVLEWRGRAARNVAICLMRFRRLRSSMSPAERAIADDWFDSLSAEQAYAVLNAIAR